MPQAPLTAPRSPAAAACEFPPPPRVAALHTLPAGVCPASRAMESSIWQFRELHNPAQLAMIRVHACGE